MAKAKKLPSGMWRVQIYSHTEIKDGKEKKVYKSFTAADKRAAEYMALEYKQGLEPKQKSVRENITLGEAIDRYVEAKNGVLSPTTIDGYEKIKKYAFQDLMEKGIYDIKKPDIQLAISKETCRKAVRKPGTIAPKTVHNEYGLLTAALNFYEISFSNISLPKIPEKEIELPEAEDVVNAIVGTSVELPCLLACWLSFSMSEVLGIRCSAIRNGNLYIENVRIKAKNKEMDKSTGKAEKRLRAHAVPPYLLKLIKEQPTYKEYKKNGTNNYLIPLTSSTLYKRFKTIINNAGFEMTFHQLRHLNASVMALLNVPEKYAMERGGWKTPQTMKKVYQHTFSTERQKVDKKMNDYFNEILKEKTGISHEISHKGKER